MPVATSAVDPLDDLFGAIKGKLSQQVQRDERARLRLASGGAIGAGGSALRMYEEGTIWTDGIAPPTFVDFVTNEMEGFLYPLQAEAIMAAIGNDPALLFHPRVDENEYYNDWPNGPPLRNIISTIILLWGKGSGKDLIISYLVSYIVFVIMHMADPYAYFHHAPGEPFDIINCAINAHQAQNVFFRKLKNCLLRECFQKFGSRPDILTDRAIFYRVVPGISEPVELIRCWSRHSKSESIEGMNIIAFILDEASGFELKGKKELAEDDEGEEYALSPADAIFDVLETSAATRFEDQYLGFVISYPRFEDDFTMRMYNRTLLDHPMNYFSLDDIDDPNDSVGLSRIGKLKYPHIFAHKAATWEVNLKKPRSAFDKFFRANPEKSAMRFACEPPPAKGGYFSQPQKIDEAFSERLRPAVQWTVDHIRRGSQELVGVKLTGHRFSPANLYVAHCDPGLSSDAFTLGIAHPNYAVQAEIFVSKGKAYTVPQVVIDSLIVWRPEPREHRVVDFINASQVILDLAGLCDMRRWSADRWNSAQLQQQLTAAGIRCEYAAFSNAQQIQQYENFKTLLYAGLIKFSGFWDVEPWRRVRDELRKLILINGTRIDHQTGGSKDCADVVVGATWLACQKGLSQRAFEGYAPPAPGHATLHQHNQTTSTLDTLRRMHRAPNAKETLRLPYAKSRISAGVS